MESLNCVRLETLEPTLDGENDGALRIKEITPEGYMALKGRNEFLNNAVPTGINIENLLQVENAHNSQFQQGTHDSTQKMFVDSISKAQLKELVVEIRELVNSLELDAETKGDLQSDIQTLEAQLSNSKPKKNIVNYALESISSILKGSIEKALASGIASRVPSIIHRLQEFI